MFDTLPPQIYSMIEFGVCYFYSVFRFVCAWAVLSLHHLIPFPFSILLLTQIYSDEEGSADYTYGNNNNKGNYGDNYDWRGGSYDDEDSYEDYSGDYKFREVDDYDSSGDGSKAIYPPSM